MNRSTTLYWRNRFNEAASKFENDADIGLWKQHGFERRFSTFFRIFQENHYSYGKKKILDVGCGSAAYTIKFKDMGYDVVGIDYAKNVINKAVEKSKGKKIPYVIGALPFLSFKENNFDIATCIGVFQSIDESSSAIEDVRKVLKEGEGILIILTLNSISIRMLYKKLLNFFQWKNKDMTNEIIEEKRYNPFKLRQNLRNKGFNNFRIVPIFIFPNMLIPLEKMFEQNGIFRVLEKVPIVSLLVAHAFIISAVKIKT